MDPQLGVNIEELLQLLQRKGIPLPWEMGTFLALATCEALGPAPARVTKADVWVDEQGKVAVTVTGASAPVDEAAAVQALVKLLGDLLIGSAPGVPPMLLALVEEGPTEQQWTLRRLRDDLEASLVPLNRGATTRVLARVIREALREGERQGARNAAAVPAEAMAGELDELLGVQPGEAPHPETPLAERPPVQAARAVDEAGLDEGPARRASRAPAVAQDDLIGRGEASSGGSRPGMLIVLLLVFVLVVLALFFAGPTRVRSWFGARPAAATVSPVSELGVGHDGLDLGTNLLETCLVGRFEA